MAAADFAGDLLVREARERREPVAEIVMGKGWPYAAAAMIAPVPERAIAPVLLLAKPIDEAAVRRLADKARGAVLLSDGKSPVIETGDGAERALLHRAVGAEGKGPLYAGAESDGSPAPWAASVSQLAPGLWMWTFGAAPSAQDSATAAGTAPILIWGAGALAAVVALFFAFRPAPPATPDGRFASGAMAFGGSNPGAAAPGATPGRGLGGARSQSGPRLSAGGAPIVGNSGGTVAGVGAAETQLYATTDDPSLADADRPVTFGRYTLLDRLGAGGMAEVYTAVTFGAEGFRRTFVVKRLRAELARDPAVVAQFIDEANLGSTLVHSNVIPVFDFGKVGDEYFLAQEYILGRDLGRITARIIERNGTPLAYPVVLHVAHETLKALEYAHTKQGDGGKALGIVHRDVSPNNVLVSARGEVKLFDFGIVKAEGRVTRTEHGVVKGNVSFMSPEQARGAEVDARADLFSMGLVIYYCLTGEVLYRGNTTYELLVRAATGPDAAEQARIDALPGPCAEIVGKALKVDPGERYQTAAEFRHRSFALHHGRRGRGGAHHARAVHRRAATGRGALRRGRPHQRSGQQGRCGHHRNPVAAFPALLIRTGTGVLILHLESPNRGQQGDHIYRTAQPCRALGELENVTVVSGSLLTPTVHALIDDADVLVLCDVVDADFLPIIEARRRRRRLTVYEINDQFLAPQPWNPDRLSGGEPDLA